MSTESPNPQQGASQLTALPSVEDIPRAGDGLDANAVREAFDAFRRHVAQLQAQLRVLQAAGSRAGGGEASGHAVRMDALHLIRAAAEFADTIERDAQNAGATQLSRVEQEITRRHAHVADRESAVERSRQETDRQRAETLNAARNESRELLSRAQADAARELQEAEARGARLLEQSRHQATELTNSARAEVEQTLEWARNQAHTVIARAQHGAEQLLAAAGLGPDKVGEVAASIMRSAEQANAPQTLPPTAALAGAPAEEQAEPEGSEPSEPQP
jgi:cell division septum initiation protein DivIVA